MVKQCGITRYPLRYPAPHAVSQTVPCRVKFLAIKLSCSLQLPHEAVALQRKTGGNYFHGIDTVIYLIYIPGCRGGSDCCTKGEKCYEGEGDCDNDDECMPGLRCGVDNCRVKVSPWHFATDCCYKPGR